MLRELTGPSLLSPLPGWLLELEGSALVPESAWESFRIAFPAQVERLIPAISCPIPDQPIECCVSLAQRLLGPIRLSSQLIVSSAAAHLQARVALCRGSHHELIGESLLLALAICQEMVRPGFAQGSRAEILRRAAAGIQQRARSVTSHAFTNAVIDNAGQRGLQLSILHQRLAHCPLLQIGTGSRSRLVYSSSSNSDSVIGGYVCHDKSFSQQILRRLGYPVPRQIKLSRQAEAAQLVEAARQLGYPCVLKPSDAERGAGVTIDIRDKPSLLKAAATARAAAANSALLVEEHVPGDYHRLVVIEEQLVRVLRCQPPHLIGDGQRSIRAILAEPSSDQSLPGGLLCNGSLPELDEQMIAQLQRQGLTQDDVPPAGVRVILHHDLQDREEWVCESVLDRVDQSLHRLAVGIAKALGMANVGIDVLSPDITRPDISRQLWVIEVNAIQLLHPGMAPLLLATMFPQVPAAHIPVSVVVSADQTTWPNGPMLQRLLADHPGYALALPVRLGERLESEQRMALETQRPIVLYRHPREVLLNRCLNAVLFLIDWHELSHSGLPSVWVDELQLLGDPPNGMASSWGLLMDSMVPRACDGSSCPLPAYYRQWS